MADKQMILKHAVGLATKGHRHTPIFVRGMHLPVSWTKMFLTAKDNQEEIEIHVLQGDSLDANECRNVAVFKIKNIPPKHKRMDHEIKATFEIDTSGQIHLYIRDLSGHPLRVESDTHPIEKEEISIFSGYGNLAWISQGTVS